jgi:hypothetical protein
MNGFDYRFTITEYVYEKENQRGDINAYMNKVTGIFTKTGKSSYSV